MANEQQDSKVAYPYMTPAQWHGIRERLRKSVPKLIDVDWVMAALGTSEKGAKNVLPQLRAVGLINSDGAPVGELVQDLRDDNTYSAACRQILDSLYPSALLDAWPDADADADNVAAWFMRNAGTGAATAKMQARLYLLLLGGETPSAEEAAKLAAVKKTSAPAQGKPSSKRASSVSGNQARKPAHTDEQQQSPPPPPPSSNLGPNLHIDMQIHISADASDSQIDAIFQSMARHLYGR